MNPAKGKIEIPGDTIALQDTMDAMVTAYLVTPISHDDRNWLRYNYAECANKYNSIVGKRIMLENISSVVAAAKYRDKKTDRIQ